jgi:uncharacterized membrane protein
VNIWTIIRFLHVTAAILWVGGQLTLTLIIRPVADREVDSETKTGLITAIGARYGRIASFGLIPILLATGFALTYHHGVEFGGLRLSTYATTLTLKIILAFVSFGLAMAHGMVALRSSSSAVRIVGVASTTVSVLVVLLAVMLVG